MATEKVKDVINNILTFCEGLKKTTIPEIESKLKEIAQKDEKDPVWEGAAKEIVDELGARATALNA